MARKTLKLVLRESYPIAPNVKHFVFDYVSDDPPPFVAGQFINLLLEKDGEEHRRSYSIASICQQALDKIEFAAAYVDGGFASELLFKMKPGAQVNALGPLGKLVLQENDPKRYILVGTGTGVTPYRAMIPDIERRLQANPALTVNLLLGIRSPDELNYADDFRRLAGQQDRFNFTACFSRLLPDTSSHDVCKGYVQQQFKALDLTPGQDIIYLCGNPNMIDAAFEQLTEIGFDAHSVKREKYISGK